MFIEGAGNRADASRRLERVAADVVWRKPVSAAYVCARGTVLTNTFLLWLTCLLRNG